MKTSFLLLTCLSSSQAGCLALPDQRRTMEHLEANAVGEGHALFYIAFGTLLEKMRDYDAAKLTYERGMQR